MSSSGQIISQDVLRNFRYYLFVRHLGKRVVHLIYYYSFLVGQQKAIQEILIDSGISLGRKGPFNTQEVTNLTVKPPEELDITVLNKICQCLWQKGVNDPGDKIKDLVKRIKDERNNVCHEETNISLMDLPTKIANFQIVLEDGLNEAKAVFPHPAMEIDQLQADIKSAVPKLLEKIRENYDPQNPDDIQRLQQEITLCWDQLSRYIVQLSQEEIKSNKDLCKVRPFDWLVQYGVTDPSQFIVNLKMDQEKEFHGDFEGSKSISVKEQEILIITDHNGQEPKVVLISGDAGSGKTTLLSSVVENWHKDSVDISDISSFEILLYMQFRNHGHNNFDEYLQNLLPNVISMFGLEHVKASILKSKCLILCDGFDEANPESEKLFKDMLSLNYKELKMLVTTRPSNTERLTDVVNKANRQRINLSVVGLSLQDMEELIGKITNHLMPNDVTRRDEMKRDLTQAINGMDDNMIACLTTPLYFNLYILLHIKCPDLRREIRSVTTLFMQLKKHMFKRISVKTGIQMKLLEEFEKLLRKWSLQNYINEKYELCESDVAELKSEVECQDVLQHFDSIMSCYFNVKHRLNHLDIEKVFCYRHRSEQEFTVANIICEDIIKLVKNNEENVFESVFASAGILGFGADGRITDLLPFIVGVLYSSNKDAFYKVIGDIHKYLLRGRRKFITLDRIVIPFAETHFDENVLKSLVTTLKSLPGERVYTTEEDRSLFSLKLLLPCLSPRHVQSIEIRSQLRNLPVLVETLGSANRKSIPVQLHLRIDLEDIAKQSAQAHTSDTASCFVDKLEILIYDRKDVDLSTLHQLPFTSEKLDIWMYNESTRDLREYPQIFNVIWPRRQKTEVTKKQEISAFPLLASKLSFKLKKKAEKPQDFYQQLHIIDWGQNTRYTEEDLRYVIEALTIQPLTKLRFIGKSEYLKGIKDGKSLRELCQREGLGNFEIGGLG